MGWKVMVDENGRCMRVSVMERERGREGDEGVESNDG